MSEKLRACFGFAPLRWRFLDFADRFIFTRKNFVSSTHNGRPAIGGQAVRLLSRS